LGGSVTIVTGPASTAVSSNITMAANNNYFVDTSAARTLTLPASPSLGDTIAIYDASGTAATNNITIARNGSNINAQAVNAIIDVNQSGSVFIYTGATVGWRFD
jgi:VCBS repeat-containing protein